MMVFMYAYVLSINMFKKKHTQHAFVYDSHFSTKYKSKKYVAIIDNISFASICVLEGEKKAALRNMIKKLFDLNFIVEFALKVTAHDSPKHIMDQYL